MKDIKYGVKIYVNLGSSFMEMELEAIYNKYVVLGKNNKCFSRKIDFWKILEKD